MKQKRIGELLLDAGCITSVQLEHALAQQRLTGNFLGAVLVKNGSIKPDALLKALSRQFGIPHESIDPQRIDWRAARPFPPSLLSAGRAFPIRADTWSVTVAIIDPLDAMTLSGIERSAGSRAVKLVLVLEEQLLAVVRAYQQQKILAIEARLNRHDDRATQ